MEKYCYNCDFSKEVGNEEDDRVFAWVCCKHRKKVESDDICKDWQEFILPHNRENDEV